MNFFDILCQSNILIKISMIILIGFSIISWSIILHRSILLNTAQHKLKKFEKRIWSGIELSNLYKGMTVRRNTLDGVEKIFYLGFKEFSKLYYIKNHQSSELVIARTLHVMRVSMHIELEKLECHIPLIGTIGSISPYIGLFGTVLGIIHIFQKLGQINNNVINQMIHIKIIAPGVSEALISTALGLFVAIPAVIAFNYLNVKINNINNDYNNFIEEFITILHHQTSCYSQSNFHSNN